MEATLEIRRVPLASLHADPANARAHDERNLDAIRGSLERFRQVEPLVVQRSTGRVVGGNGRLVAMKAMGWTECDIVELDLDDVQATALGIALNRTSDLAAWDLPALGKLLDSLRAEDALDGVGFGSAKVSIDQTVYNPGRITKLYGTLACKGDALPDRPHRRSSLKGGKKPKSQLSIDKTRRVLRLALAFGEQHGLIEKSPIAAKVERVEPEPPTPPKRTRKARVVVEEHAPVEAPAEPAPAA